MGRCGRCRQNDGSNPSDVFALILNLNDCVCMNERIFATDSNNDKETANTIRLSEAVIAKKDQMEMQRNDLFQVLKLLHLNKDSCLHDKLEKITASPMEPHVYSNMFNPCRRACMICSNSLSDFILPVKKSGVQSFLCQVFIQSSSESINGNYILNKLQKFPNVGIDVCGRPKSPNAPDTRYLHSTMLQLIAAELIILNCSAEQPKATFALGIAGTMPTHTLDSNWTHVSLLENTQA